MAAVALMLAAFTFAVGVAQPVSVEKALPNNFAGEFRWYGDPAIQLVEIKILVVGRLDTNRIEATGCGRYNASGRITNIRVRMVIEEPTLDVEIFESNPVTGAFFTVDGSHKGKLVDNLQAIDAEWTERSTDEKGRLQLRAGPAVTCAPQVASN